MNNAKAEAGGANNSPASSASLETMLGKHNFEAQGRVYALSPIKLKHIPEFKDKNNRVYIPGSENSEGFLQFVYLQDDQYVKNLDRWLRRQLQFNGEPATYEMMVEHDWDVDDIGRFLTEMTRVSG